MTANSDHVSVAARAGILALSVIMGLLLLAALFWVLRIANVALPRYFGVRLPGLLYALLWVGGFGGIGGLTMQTYRNGVRKLQRKAANAPNGPGPVGH